MNFSAIRLLLAGTAWRRFGSASAGQTLLDAMSGDDEQAQMLAGMSLVKAGNRSTRLIQAAIAIGLIARQFLQFGIDAVKHDLDSGGRLPQRSIENMCSQPPHLYSPSLAEAVKSHYSNKLSTL